MNCNDIRKTIFQLSDEKFRKFNSALMPNVDLETIIGVKTPQLRLVAKNLYKSGDYKQFIDDLPHKYFEENQIHAFVIAEIENFDICINLVATFLPYIDNWATCDQLSPKVFAKHKNELLGYIKKWLESDHTYTIRFGINMLMKHFLCNDFKRVYADSVANISSGEYYVNMARAWYFATALATNENTILPYIENQRLDVWTHNKAIQKSIESNRIPAELKAYLRELKVK